MGKQKELMPDEQAIMFLYRNLALMIRNASGRKRRVQKCYAVILVGLMKPSSQSVVNSHWLIFFTTLYLMKSFKFYNQHHNNNNHDKPSEIPHYLLKI